jgi:hypothetical protein
MGNIGTNKGTFIISCIGRSVAEPCPNMIVSANLENVYALKSSLEGLTFLELAFPASRAMRNTIGIFYQKFCIFITKFVNFLWVKKPWPGSGFSTT